MNANNAPLQGYKGSYYEGGIRTPFVVSWPASFAGGRTIDTPVISLDILPTVLEAVGESGEETTPMDGRSLLPLLKGETAAHHEALFWSDGGERGQWAVRKGDWKLHGMKDETRLIHLAKDASEQENLAAEEPERVAELTRDFDTWLGAMAPPATPGVPKRWSGEQVMTEEEKRAAKKAARKLERRRQAAEGEGQNKQPAP